MNQLLRIKIFEDLLEDIVDELDISESRYEDAERAYLSLAEWLDRPESSLRNARPKIYVHGSFALGTATKPVNEDEEYDVDAVCELLLSKAHVTQKDVKDALGHEIWLYVRAKNMNKAPERRNRCWTLHYADEAQFHLDTLPAIPDGDAVVALYRRHGISNPYLSTSLAITDERHPQFAQLTMAWRRSNPRGFQAWFRMRMGGVFEERRRAIAARARASVEQIPDYKVKTPLQSAIQILKRHRDIWALGQAKPDNKPISIIITTLAAHAYRQETSIAEALFRILSDMDHYIERRGGAAWIMNPSDPFENFADRWGQEPAREHAFYEWLDAARRDFQRATTLADRGQIIQILADRLGERVVRAAAVKRVATPGLLTTISRRFRELFRAPHRAEPQWPLRLMGAARIVEATAQRDGFRPRQIRSDGPPLAKGHNLTFTVRTEIPRPYRIYWQIVNTGTEATQADQLRGLFEEHYLERGGLTKHESTLYAGLHSIQCFIVKDGCLVAQSEPFLINIA
jgi:predicted nucleotidyltransferase